MRGFCAVNYHGFASDGIKVDVASITLKKLKINGPFLLKLVIFAVLICYLRPVQTLAKLLANKTQQCGVQHVASVCTPCCVLLRVVATCWKLLDEV